MDTNRMVIENGILLSCEGDQEEIQVPEEVKVIYSRAFERSPAVRRVTLPEGIKEIRIEAFSSCRNLTEIRIPDSITTLQEEVFRGCVSLTHVTLSRNLTSIGASAFSGCRSLKRLDLPDSVALIGQMAFAGSGLETLRLPDGVRSLSFRLLRGCSFLKEITLPAELREIQEDALAGCASLQELNLPPSLETVGAGAFQSCLALRRVSFPDGVTRLPPKLFSGVTLERLEAPGVDSGIENLTRQFAKEIRELVLPQVPLSSLPNWTEAALKGLIRWEASGHVLFEDVRQSATQYALLQKRGDLARGRADLALLAFLLRYDSIAEPDVRSYLLHARQTGNSAAGNLLQASLNRLTGVTPPALYPAPRPRDMDVQCEGNVLVRWTGKERVAVVPEKVKVIGEKAFQGNPDLEMIVLPAGLTSIRPFAFANCPNLSAIRIPDAVTELPAGAFQNCYSLKTLALPRGMKVLGPSALEGCVRLTELSLPSALETIGEGAFRNCLALGMVTLPAGVSRLPAALLREVTLNTLEAPGVETGLENLDDLFATRIRLLILPRVLLSSVPERWRHAAALGLLEWESRGNVLSEETRADLTDHLREDSDWLQEQISSNPTLRVFLLRESLVTVPELETVETRNILPPSLQPELTDSPGERTDPEASPLAISGELTIRDGVLLRCNSTRKELVLPDGITTIGDSAFRKNSSLERIDLPDSVTTIRQQAFANCSALRDIELPDTVEDLHAQAFKGCASLEKIRIPSGVKMLPAEIFAGCTSLKDVRLPDQMTAIGSRAFSGCDSLERLDLPDSVITISAGAFRGCKALRRMVFPAGVTRLEKGIFNGTSLEYLEAPGISSLASATGAVTGFFPVSAQFVLMPKIPLDSFTIKRPALLGLAEWVYRGNSLDQAVRENLDATLRRQYRLLGNLLPGNVALLNLFLQEGIVPKPDKKQLLAEAEADNNEEAISLLRDSLHLTPDLPSPENTSDGT